MNKDFRSYLQFKALSHRFSASQGTLLDMLLASTPTKESVNANGDDVHITELSPEVKLQNVCAKIGLPLVERLESTLSILSMSKREFIEIAIISALDETDRIFAENDVFADDDVAETEQK